KINMLELQEEVKNKLYSILEEDGDNLSTEERFSDDEQINIAYSFDNSGLSDSCGCGSAICTCNSHIINIIASNSNEILFDMINDIRDSEIKKNLLDCMKGYYIRKIN
ncbi:MAG: hypothetical protein Q8830_03585, partial [Candidatus Phytoplasma australasiaticum]|nr:hypothetical protein [Candidatus Phytoplasma australasiaticum]